MLTATECWAWARRLDLSAAAWDAITTIRVSPPSRLVRSGAGNVPCRYPSAKMGHTIQAESHTVELPFVHAMEGDRTVLEYWDQPPKIPLAYLSKTGRRVVTGHTPDFFVLRIDSAGWIECKPEERLHQLAQASPQRYCLGADGHWTCPPGEAYAARFGLTYRVYSSAETNWVEQRNWEYLADYVRADCPSVGAQAHAAILQIVEDNPGVTLAELQRRVKGRATADAINILIATARLYVDLRAYALAEPDYAPVFRDAEMAQAHRIVTKAALPVAIGCPQLVTVEAATPVLWDGRPWTIGNVTETHTPLISEKGVPVELLNGVFEAYVREGRIVGVPVQPAEGLTEEGRTLLAQASIADQAEANRRYAVIRPYLEDHVPLSACASCIPERTKFDWARKWRDAAARYGHGYIGLLPRSGNRAHRPRILSDAVITLLHATLEEHYATYRHKRKRHAYGPFLRACQARGLPEVSERTFYAEASRYLTTYEEKLAREGHRAAYPYRAPHQEITRTHPRHGDRPWQLAHIDHTEVDLELLSSRTGRPLGKAWVTVLLDATSRRILALFLTYNKPSYVSCMMAIRLCVQRWGRLPRAIVVDGGPEFHSTSFETLLAWYKVTLKTRPPSEPKYGSICERLFGTANSTFIHALLGNTQVMKNVRQVTQAVHPKTHARWTLGDLYAWLCEWAYEVYDTIDHPALGQSPRDAYRWAEHRSGARAHARIPYDRDFIIRTFPTTRKGTALVQPGYGVKIHTILYWASDFDDPEIERTAVAVRYDPFDMSHAYAYLTKYRRWVECHADYCAALQGHSEREMMLIADEVRQQHRVHTAGYKVTAKALATFQARAEEHEEILLQREYDGELRAVFTVMHGGRAEATAPVPMVELDAVCGARGIALVPSERPAAIGGGPVAAPRVLPRLE